MKPSKTNILPPSLLQYFSTLERLRFAQGSTDVEGIFNHYDDITSHKTKRRKHGPKRSVPDPYTCRESLATTGSSDDSLFPGIPEKSKNTRLTREEQCELVKQLRASVILDAADEAIYNVRHKTSNKNLAPTSDIDWSTPTLAPRRGSLDSMSATMIRSEPIGKGDPARESLYESFRWLDEEEDLDLRLFLDDYHANLREELPNTGKNTKQPSFRRHLSISKLPFGRSSFSNRPDATGRESPAPNLNLTQQPQTEHFRRRSRTLSLRERRRHAQSGSLSAIDPSAAHYQDPEARLKLRVYLASPQKFDEAIEFGFPATDAVDTPPTVEYRRSVLRKRQSRQNLNDDAGAMRTFLDDDGVDEGDELDDDDDDDDASSISDLDSPKTPQLGGLTPPPGNYRPGRVSTEPLHPLSVSSRGIRPQPSVSDSLYAAIPASSREMTLRMTLTRPDLRADEDLIYGWQQQQQQQHMQAQGQSQHQQAGHAASGSGRKSPSSGNALREDGAGGGAGQGPAMYLGPGQGQGRPHKESFEAILTGNHDQYGPDGAGGDKNFMKRIFNRVRRA